MRSRRYNITSLQILLDPDADEIDGTSASIDLILPQEPTLTDDGQELRAEFELEIELAKHDPSLSEDNEDENDVFGEVEVEFLAIITSEGEDFEEMFPDTIETWENEGYRALPSEFRQYLESGILSDVLSPISDLNRGLRGVLPAVPFSQGLSDEGEEEGETDQGTNEE